MDYSGPGFTTDPLVIRGDGNFTLLVHYSILSMLDLTKTRILEFAVARSATVNE
jgi:hypothetical protein